MSLNQKMLRNAKSRINTGKSSVYAALRLVEATGLEPAASWSQTKHSTKLSYASKYYTFILFLKNPMPRNTMYKFPARFCRIRRYSENPNKKRCCVRTNLNTPYSKTDLYIIYANARFVKLFYLSFPIFSAAAKTYIRKQG